MSVLDEANRLARAGQQQAAVELVLRAADADDPEAQFAVANWRLFAIHGGRDIAEAHRLLDQAIAGGHVEAARTKSALLANGTGDRPDRERAIALLEQIRDRDPQADAQLRLIADMAEPNIEREALSNDPAIEVVRKLFSRAECDYVMSRAQPELRPSFVVDPRTGGFMPHPARTSHGMNFDPTIEDVAVRSLNERLARASGTDVEWGEPLHILRYAPGQEYKPHFDAIPNAQNQRNWTILVYLNDGYSGGETRFDLLNIEFRGVPGDALIFRNVDSSGHLDPRTRHAGMPVTGGIKWLATRWIRAAPHDRWTTAY